MTTPTPMHYLENPPKGSHTDRILDQLPPNRRNNALNKAKQILEEETR